MKFIIASRVYNPKSQGCVLLHKLVSTLNDLGHEALMIFFNGHGSEAQWFISGDPQYFNPDFNYLRLSNADQYSEFANGAVVVYPEIITGNPLRSEFVVRYMLNREGFIKKGVPINPGEKDFILSHSMMYHENPDYLIFNYHGDYNFHSKGSKVFYERDIDVTYIGKGAKYAECFIVEGSTEVTRLWPSNKVDLANLLRKTRFFYTWDAISATNVDAMLCGAFPVFMQYEPITKDEVIAMRDIGLEMPIIEYRETLSNSANEFYTEAAKFLAHLSDKLLQNSDEWIYKVEVFVSKLRNHYGLRD
jgi:hypothetical protein